VGAARINLTRLYVKAICEELKLDLREARERLRGAVRAGKYPALAKSRTPWQWEKGTATEKDARAA